MRNIQIFTSVGTSKTISTDARTFGELVPLLHEQGIETVGTKAMIGETKTELSSSISILPEGNFNLFIMPAKTKSGNDLNAVDFLEGIYQILKKWDDEKEAEKAEAIKAKEDEALHRALQAELAAAENM